MSYLGLCPSEHTSGGKPFLEDRNRRGEPAPGVPRVEDSERAIHQPPKIRLRGFGTPYANDGSARYFRTVGFPRADSGPVTQAASSATEIQRNETWLLLLLILLWRWLRVFVCGSA